jgi:hypothetical protein
VIEALVVVSTASLEGEVILAGGYLRGELFGFAVEPGDVGEEVLFIEGAGFVVGELVVSHNKIIQPII